MAKKNIPPSVQEAIAKAQEQYERAWSNKKSTSRFSIKYATSFEYLEQESAKGRFNPQSSTGKRILRDIREGHATFDLASMRGHGRPWTVKGLFDEQGKLSEVELKNRRQASLWGDYYNALQKFRKGDTNALKPFVGKSYVDADSKKHEFPTDFDTLYRLDKAGEIPHGDEISLSSRAA
jgi:hypothetical protein